MNNLYWTQDFFVFVELNKFQGKSLLFKNTSKQTGRGLSSTVRGIHKKTNKIINQNYDLIGLY